MAAPVAIVAEADKLGRGEACLDEVIGTGPTALAAITGGAGDLEVIFDDADILCPAVPVGRHHHLHIHALADMDHILFHQHVGDIAGELEDAQRVVAADIVARDGAAIAQIILVVAAGRTDQQEAAGIVVAVIVEQCRAARIEVAVEALPVIAGAGKGGLVELDQAVVGAPLPDAGIIAGRSGAGIAHDIMFDQRAVGAARDDAVAANILDQIVADHDLFAREPVLGADPVGNAGNAGPVDLPDDIAFDHQILKAGRQLLAGRAEDDAAIILAIIHAAHVVDIHVADADTARHAPVDRRDQHAETLGRGGIVVGDFQPADADIFGVDDAHAMGRDAAGVDARPCAGAEGGDADRRAGAARAGDGERFLPARSGHQQHLIARHQRIVAHPRQAAPGLVGGGAGSAIIAGGAVDIIGRRLRRGCRTRGQDQERQEDCQRAAMPAFTHDHIARHSIGRALNAR